MANLGLCRKCGHCLKISPLIQNSKGIKILSSQAWCELTGVIEWDSSAPDGCPYLLEHIIMSDDVSELAETEEL